MKKFRWFILLSLSLVALSAILYFIHYATFHDAHHIFIYLIGDIAFVPIEVLFVTLIIHRLLSEREKRSVMKKLNMVIGTFFSEVGMKLLSVISKLDKDPVKMREKFKGAADWRKTEVARLKRAVKRSKQEIEVDMKNFEELKRLLVEKRESLVRLLENPNLLEHESFTDLLWAVFHLAEELEYRPGFTGLPETDVNHLKNDVARVYKILLSEWIAYMYHLKRDYPYLFSLALRINPLDEEASPIVT